MTANCALGLARAAAQFFLHRENRLHRLMRREQRFQDRLFVNDLRAALEHHDRLGVGRDDHREVAALELRVGGIDDDFAVHPAHPDRRNRAFVRDVGDQERSRGRDQREHVGIVVTIGGEHGHDDLGFAIVALGKQRAHRSVDQARGQSLLFGGAPFPFEEAAGNFAGGERLLDVVHRERQKVHVGPRFILRDRGREHDGIAVGREHTAVRLAGQAAGFERELAPRKINFEFMVHE